MRSYAVLLCRVAGLRQAIATEAPAELGGGEFAIRASEELERIFSLSKNKMEEERAKFVEALGKRSDNYNVPMEVTYSSGAWVPAFFFSLCGFAERGRA